MITTFPPTSQLSIRQACQVLGINRAWYYAHQAAPNDQTEDIRLRATIEQLILDFPGYGYRRVTKALQRGGWRVNHTRVLRLM